MKLKKSDKIICIKNLNSPIDGRIYYSKGKEYTINYTLGDYVDVTPENGGLNSGGLFNKSQFIFYFNTLSAIRKKKLKVINDIEK